MHKFVYNIVRKEQKETPKEKTMKKLLISFNSINERLGQFFSGTALGQILSAIILAAAVAGATSIAGEIKADKIEQDFYNDISIGLSKQYIEDVLGHPRNVFLEITPGLDKNCYTLKHSMMTIFYENDMVAGYFITLRDGNYKKVGRSESSFTAGMPLGSYTFESLWSVPDEIKSSQLRMDYNYLEKYYTEEDEDFYVFYYMYSGTDGFQQKNQYTSEDVFRSDEEVQILDSDAIDLHVIPIENYDELYLNRKIARPNTFGKCIMEYSKPIDECLLYSVNF